MKNYIWIKNIDNPLILFGFVLIVMAGLMALFKTNKLSGTATERLMRLGMWLSFVIGILVIAATLIQSYFDFKKENQKNTPEKERTTTEIKQTANNNSGEVNQAVRDIIKGGNPTSPAISSQPIKRIEQTAEGNQAGSIIHQSGGSIYVNP